MRQQTHFMEQGDERSGFEMLCRTFHWNTIHKLHSVTYWTVVPKGEGADTRLIFHLSFPREQEFCQLSNSEGTLYSSLQNILDYAIALCVKVGRGCYIAKSDMKSTFRNVPIKHEHWCRLVLYAHHPVTNQKFYFADKCLPFGASISCSHFQHFSDSVAHIFKWKTGDDTNNYWDDFLFAALLKALCNGHVEIFLDLCKTINFSVALDKTNWGTQVFVFLGFLINMILQMVSIPETKCNKAIVHINSILAKRKGNGSPNAENHRFAQFFL